MKILLFRGLFGDIFSTGMDELARKLATKGYDTSVHRWTERPVMEKRLLAKPDNEGLILIGHSLGANAACNLAAKLQTKGQKIHYLATLDPTNPPLIPQEIEADNIRSSFVLARNMQNSRNYSLPELTHTQLDNSPIVHNFIIDRVINILPFRKKLNNFRR